MSEIVSPPPSPRSSLPIALTLTRMAAGPLVAGLVIWAAHMAYIEPARAGRLMIWATGLFAVAALTDWLDGWLARRTGSVSAMGAALDHSADKVLCATVLAAMAYASLPVDLVIATVVLLGRDMAIAGLREGLRAEGAGVLKVGQVGKFKTTAALIGIGALLAHQAGALLQMDPELLQALGFAGRALIWAAVALAVISGGQYALATARNTAKPERDAD